MDLLHIAVVVAVAATLLPLAIRGLVWRHVRERRLRVPRIRPVDPEWLPEAIDPVFEAAECTLEPLGFERVGARWIESVDESEGPRPERVYGHRESGALAFVGPPLPGMGERPYRVSFVSRLRDGSVLATFDGLSHLSPGFPPSWTCFDHDVNDLGRQWALHLHALEPRGGLEATIEVPLEDWTRREEAALRETVLGWEAAGLTRPAPPVVEGDAELPGWRFRALAAWSLSGRFLKGQRRVLASEAEAARSRARQELWRDHGEPVADALGPRLDRARAAGMAWGYRYEREARRTRQERRGGRGRWPAAAASGALCLLAFGWWVGWQLAWILIGVLLLHELGHFAAMEAFGYRDRRILFLPFVGAATLGESEDASPSQRTLVYLLGPAPGLLLGLVALYAFLTGGSVWWLAAATTALLVNYLNLLPISPLDGGRVVETLLLGRFPRAQVVFLGLGAVAFAAGAWLLGDPILAGIALALFISLRSAWTAAGVLIRARERLARPNDEDARVRQVFEILQEPPYASAPAAGRLRIARIVIPRLSHRPATLRTALAGGLVYVVMLVGVPVAVGASLVTFAPEVAESVVAHGAAEAAGHPAAGPSASRSAAEPEVADQSSAASISEASLVGR